MRIEKIGYREGDTELEGHLALPAYDTARKPVVLVAHAWRGQTDFERDKAEALASLGWVGLALDVYGKGVTGTNDAECAELMQPLLDDRALLQRRLLAGLEAARSHPRVDGSHVAAIGFCFGGLAVLDLARSGAELRGVVAFHGLFHPNGLRKREIKARVLALHGFDDPMAKPEQMVAFGREMTEAKVDWQIHAYGNTVHAFTNPQANDPAHGTVFDAKADRRSWAAMRAFLDEAFANTG
jgi:dienelactone hydrolase